MSKRIVASFTLFAFLTLGVPVVASPSGVAVESSEGSITLRGDTSDWSSARAKGLALGDSVVVGPDSQVTLLFPNGSRVRVAPDSEFRLQAGEEGTPTLYLLRGRVISSVTSSMVVETYRSNAVASQGEFVLETSPSNTGLKVLSGNAHLQPNRGQAKSYNLLTSAPTMNQDITKRVVMAFDQLASQQTVQDENVYGAQKGKGAGIRKERDRDNTGGVGRVAPDQDMLPPGKDTAATPPPKQAPPVSTTTAPPPTTAPLTTPPVTGALPAVAGGSAWPWILGGLGTALGAIALITDDNGNNNGNTNIFFGGNGNGNQPNVPSPSLP
jgi:FecR-like protein